MSESTTVLEDFQVLAKVLRFMGHFHYCEDHSRSLRSRISYKWSNTLFAISCLMTFIWYTLFFLLNPDIFIKINHVTVKVLIILSYTLIQLGQSFLERNLFTNLLFEFQVFDDSKQIFKLQQNPLHTKYYRLYVGLAFILFIILVLSFLVFISTNYFSPDQDWRSITRTVFMLPGNYLIFGCTYPFTIVFLFFANELSLRFRNLHENFTSEFQCVPEESLELFLDNYRVLYFKLCRVLHKFNSCFGYAAITFYCHVYSVILYCMWELLVSTHHPITIFDIITIVAEAYVVAKFAEDIVNESYGILDVLFDIPVTNLPSRCQQQISLFILQVRSVENSVSAAKHFKINKSLVLSVMTSTVAYFTVIISLVPSNQSSAI